MRGDAPEHQEGLSDIGMCSLRGWGSAWNLCRPCKFQVVESGHPVLPLAPQQTESVRLHRDSREIGEHQNSSLGDGCGVERVRSGDEEMLEPTPGLGI